MTETSKQEPAIIVTKAYDLVIWLLPKVERFPRSYRISVGDRLVSSGLDLLTSLVQASYANDKAGLLQGASLQANTVRYLLRLAKDLKLITVEACCPFPTEPGT